MFKKVVMVEEIYWKPLAMEILIEYFYLINVLQPQFGTMR
jgi:hypothetical protein